MRRLIGITAIAGGLLLILTPRYILPACEYEGFSRMHCSDTAQAEKSTGVILFATGIATLFIKKAGMTLTGGLSVLALSVVSFTLPDIFGYCMSSRMPCNYGMVPGLRFIAVMVGIIMIVSVAGITRNHRKKGTT
jgi:hypothetical protein